MKKFMLVVILLVVTATVANAASINGDFKGNPIVKVIANGKELTVENTPAVIYNGNTLVPIYMLRQLGATVAWNPSEYSVTVSMPSSQHAINQVKIWAQVADYYSRMNNLIIEYTRTIERINSTGITIDLSANNEIVVRSFEDIQNLIDYIESQYNHEVNQGSNLVRTHFLSMNYTTTKLDEIETNLNVLINDFLKILTSQLEYYQNKTTSNWESYIKLANAAFDKIEKTKTLVNEEYNFFQNGIINHP